MAPEVFRKPAGFRELSVKHVRAGPHWPTVQSRFQRGLPLAQDGDSSGASPKPGRLRRRADPLRPSGATKPKPFSLKWKTRQGLGFLFSFVLFLMSVSSRGHVLVALSFCVSDFASRAAEFQLAVPAQPQPVQLPAGGPAHRVWPRKTAKTVETTEDVS